VLRRSKYEVVRNAIGDVPEVNALEASIPSQGVGTLIMACAEREAAAWGASTIGLGVAVNNIRARDLYTRLGYEEWGQGTVCDRWAERDQAGVVVAEHADECLYLTKRLDS
jgi:hypothetical protein